MLRVLLVIDRPVLPAWQANVLDEVTSSSHAAIAGVISLDRSMPAPGGPIFRAYQALDRRLFPVPNDPLAACDVTSRLAALPRVSDPASVAPDLVLKLASAPSAPAWISAARLGVWSFDHVERSVGGAPDFLGELVRRDVVQDVRLCATTPEGVRVRAHGVAATHPTSLGRSRHPAYWKAAALVGRALRDATDPAAPEPARVDTPVTPEAAPSGLRLGRWLVGAGLRLVHDRILRRGQSETWFVGLRATQGTLCEGPMTGFAPLPMPGDRFYADPFLVADGDRVWLFFEDADRSSGKGVIRCTALDAEGRPGESRVVLAADTHLSYPNVFRRDGAWYMLPETHAARRVELWRATDFPWQWTRERVLLDGVRAVDPTLLEHEGRLWLFVGSSVADHVPADELHAFHAEALEGPWTPHARNPICADTRTARPAGPFFREGGQLLRPAQDCSESYGSAFWLQRVEVLDPERYRETPVRRVGRDWWPGLIGTHAITRAGGFDAIDGRIWWRRGRPLPG